MNIVLCGEYLFCGSVETPDGLTCSISKLQEMNKIVILKSYLVPYEQASAFNKQLEMCP